MPDLRQRVRISMRRYVAGSDAIAPFLHDDVEWRCRPGKSHSVLRQYRGKQP